MTDVCVGGLGTFPGSDRVFEDVSSKQGHCPSHAVAGFEISNHFLPQALGHVARRGQGLCFIICRRPVLAHEGLNAWVLGKHLTRHTGVPAHRGTARKTTRVPKPASARQAAVSAPGQRSRPHGFRREGRGCAHSTPGGRGEFSRF